MRGEIPGDHRRNSHIAHGVVPTNLKAKYTADGVMKVFWSVVLLGGWVGGALAADQPPPPGLVLLPKHQRSLEPSGNVRDAEVDSAAVEIAAALPTGILKMRAVSRVQHRPLRKLGQMDRSKLRIEVEHHANELELCRYKVAAAARIPIENIKAGQISLYWTIRPDGRTHDTLVFENSDTEVALMGCVRRRMNAWTFSKPQGGPVSVDFDYTFSDRLGTKKSERGKRRKRPDPQQ